MTPSRIVPAALLVAAALALPTPPSAAAATALASCQRVVVSPAFAADGTALCFGIDWRADFALRTYVTRDGARTWRAAEPAGLPATARILEDAVVSPLFADDRLLAVELDSGVYYSTDAGETFRAAPRLRGPVAIATVGAVGGAAAPAGAPGAAFRPHGVLVSPGGALPGMAGSTVFDPTIAAPAVAAGTGGWDEQFVASPRHHRDGVMFAIGRADGGTAYDAVRRLYACDASFSCTAARAAFPPGESVDRVWLAGDYDASGTLFASTVDAAAGRVRAYVSRDRGATIRPVPVLQRALDDVHAAGGAPGFAITAGPDGSRTVYARVSTRVARVNPPSERLFRSDDNGATWRLVAYGRSPQVRAPRGTMPYAHAHSTTDIVATPLALLTYAGGRLLMWGHRGEVAASAVWCSADRGVRWTPTCR